MSTHQNKKSEDITKYLSKKAKIAFQHATQFAIETHRHDIDTGHLLWGILHVEDNAIDKTLELFKIDKNQLIEQVRDLTKKGNATTQTPKLTPAAKRAVQLGFQTARELGHKYAENVHVLFGLIKVDGVAAKIFQKNGVSKQVSISVMKLRNDKDTKTTQQSQTLKSNKNSHDLTKHTEKGNVDIENKTSKITDEELETKQDLKIIENYFKKYSWEYEIINSKTISSAFTFGNEKDFTLFVKVDVPWVYFFTPLPFTRITDAKQDENRCRIYHYLSSINYEMLLIKASIDEDEEILLSAEVPLFLLNYDMFETILNGITYYAPRYHSTILKMLKKH